MIAEKVEGVLYLAGNVIYPEAKAGYGGSFEQVMTGSEHGVRDKTYYRVVRYTLPLVGDKDPLTCMIRFEVDAIDSEGDTVELKSK